MNGVSAKYGNDSREYEMAGGTRKSDRIRSKSKLNVLQVKILLNKGLKPLVCPRYFL